MGWFDDIFGGGQEKGYQDMQQQIQNAIAAQKAAEQQAQQQVSPYAQAGTGALSAEQKFLGGMADPQSYIDKIMGGWKMSPQAQFELNQGIQAANRGAAASGMLGSGAEQKALTQYGQQVSSRDMQNYLNNILGVGREYLGGQSGLAGMGLRGAEDIGRYQMGLGGQLGDDYGALGRAQFGQDVSHASGINRLLGAGLGLAGSIFGF